jgi:hypothetical protein
MQIVERFTEHPATVGETYGQHFVSAISFSATMLWAALCCAIHAFLPFIFETTGRSTIASLHDRMCVHRKRTESGTRLSTASCTTPE